MKVYEASTLFDTMSTRKREYETLREQLITLQKAFQSIVELDEALKGKGADAIKGFYQAQLDVLSLWLQLVDRNIAFYNGVPEGAASRNLENETVELPFLEDELSNSESRAREMIAEQQEDLQRIFDRISDIQPLHVFSRNEVDQQLDEAKMKREETIESVEQFDEELTSKYTMLESDEQVLTALFSELMNASSQGNQVSSIYYDAASFHSSDIYSAIAASQAEAASVKKEQTSQEVESAGEENENPFIESVNSFKEIGNDYWAGFQERGEKKMDSLYDFGNYLTSGLFDGVRGAVSAMDERSDKAMDSPYDFVNYLTSGGADLVKDAVNPEDDFSKEHWLSSFGLAAMVAGARVSIPKSGTAKMSNIKHTVHPDGTRKVMKETYQKVVQGPLMNTRVDMQDLVRKVLDYQVPLRTDYALAGVGDIPHNTVRDMGKDARETFHIISGKKDGSTKNKGKEYKNYKAVEYKGTTKINGKVKDTSRRVYQRIDIDYERVDPKTGKTNLQLMKSGRPPIWKDGTKIELHHLIQREPGAMVELPSSMHKEYDRILHGLVENGGSFRNDSVLKKQYSNFRLKYWRWRAKEIDLGEL
ncbi:T7SS effector LXG polymorphic toxin [Pseudalkalibacillus sp. NRS-1564]|uniref:T7SS effector LXG polymorphic toxin n=1 Tax=Pseudalkalibacillus sp. NRS-1564 TaxID=3233900 RepID=UPI003D2D2534